jgi:hypothetical protein
MPVWTYHDGCAALPHRELARRKWKQTGQESPYCTNALPVAIGTVTVFVRSALAMVIA